MHNNIIRNNIVFMSFVTISLVSSFLYLYTCQEKISNLNEMIDYERSNNELLLGENKSLNSEVIYLEDEHFTLVNKLKDLKKENAKLDKYVLKLESDKEKIESKLDKSNSKISDLENSIDGLKGKVKGLESELKK